MKQISKQAFFKTEKEHQGIQTCSTSISCPYTGGRAAWFH